MTPDEQRNDAPPETTKLLDALTKFVIDEVSGEKFAAAVEREVDYGLEAARLLKLGDVITSAQVEAVALKYASEWRIGGGIPELAGEIAHRVHRRTLAEAGQELSDVVPEDSVAELTRKIATMPAFQRVVDRIYHSPVTAQWAAWFIYHVTLDALRRNRAIADNLPGVGTLLRLTATVGARVVPSLSHQADVRFRELTERLTHYLVTHSHSISDEEAEGSIVEAALELWEEHAHHSLSSLGSAVDSEDIEDFLILGFEFWRDFRKTTYFRTIVSEGIRYFFEKYSDHTLYEILEEVGVTREDMIEEAMRFAPPILDLVSQNGMLESFVRRQFAPFVDSEEVRALFNGR
ncbi:hypothetical protein ONR57_21365 [Hoyosella sp. YIM 151337]|uniref:hypothetical protein n=1 Tax=Hoyosella sp. YIM 151337 TaxID=2992742 RepID=UPI0022356381|nr:hypothetical protein [Hoyosella sp. YIM 151337]MCW4355857.1 hypothetical protein [Hoyosella sp. YIM 151337]